MSMLTHWGRVTHICVSKLTIIGSDNGLSPDRRQAIVWTNAGILLIEPLGINFSEILIEIHIFSFTKMGLKMSSGKWRPSCLGLNVFYEQGSLTTKKSPYQISKISKQNCHRSLWLRQSDPIWLMGKQKVRIMQSVVVFYVSSLVSWGSCIRRQPTRWQHHLTHAVSLVECITGHVITLLNLLGTVTHICVSEMFND